MTKGPPTKKQPPTNPIMNGKNSYSQQLTLASFFKLLQDTNTHMLSKKILDLLCLAMCTLYIIFTKYIRNNKTFCYTLKSLHSYMHTYTQHMLKLSKTIN